MNSTDKTFFSSCIAALTGSILGVLWMVLVPFPWNFYLILPFAIVLVMVVYFALTRWRWYRKWMNYGDE